VDTQVSTAARRHRRRWAHRTVGALAVATAALGIAPGTASAAPVNPSDAQLGAAQQAEEAAAAQVGQITAALAQAQAAADDAAATANIALQDYEEKQAAFDEAKIAADAAAAAAAQAAVEVAKGKADVVAFARDSYMAGTTDPGMTALLSAGGPAEIMEKAALLEAVGEHRTDVVAVLTVLQEQATVADQAAQQTVGQADTLKAEAATLLATAQEQEVSARSQTEALAVQQEQVEAQLAEAEQTLTGLEGQRDAAEAAVAQEQAAGQRAQAAPAPVAAPSSSTSSSGSSSSGSSSSGSSVGSSSGNSSSGGSSSGGSTSSTPAPKDTTAGAPSGSAVDVAIAAARSQFGVAYSWGGGGSNGPSYGIAPDTRVWGFDCSGLTQYAYAQAGIQIGGTSRDQWYRFRGQTVAQDDLQAGDLVFWGNGSSYTSIYHVALYIGGGKVIQAPQSGDVVKTSTMWFGSDYFGAVRPTG